MRQKFILPSAHVVLANQVKLAATYHANGLSYEFDYKPRYLEASAVVGGHTPLVLESSPQGMVKIDLPNIEER
jgi:hypothetical protein